VVHVGLRWLREVEGGSVRRTRAAAALAVASPGECVGLPGGSVLASLDVVISRSLRSAERRRQSRSGRSRAPAWNCCVRRAWSVVVRGKRAVCHPAVYSKSPAGAVSRAASSAPEWTFCVCFNACSPPAWQHLFGVIRVIKRQITTLRPYNARYTGDNRSIFRKRHAKIITRVSA